MVLGYFFHFHVTSLRNLGVKDTGS